MRTFLFSLTLMLSVTCIQAQDKYEYGMVKANNVELDFLTADKRESQPETSKTYQQNLLKKVNELCSQGWEVYNVTSEGQSYVIYFLRKKKN